MSVITMFIAMRNEEFINNFIPFLDRENIQVVGYTNRSDEIIDHYERLKPNIVMMDVKMYPSNSYDVMKSLLQIDQDAKIIGTSSFYYNDVSVELQAIGARGYLMRNLDLHTILGIISEVQKGNTVFDKTI